MDKNEIYSMLLDNSKPTVARWRAENRPIIQLLDTYFTPTEIFEFLEKKTIYKYDTLLLFNDLKKNVLIDKEILFFDFIYVYGNELIDVLLNLYNYIFNSKDSKFNIFINTYQKDAYFRQFIDDLISNNFSYYIERLETIKSEYDFKDDFIYDFFVNLNNKIS